MPEFLAETYASRGALGLAARRPGGAAVAADQASESADYRSASCDFTLRRHHRQEMINAQSKR